MEAYRELMVQDPQPDAQDPLVRLIHDKLMEHGVIPGIVIMSDEALSQELLRIDMLARSPRRFHRLPNGQTSTANVPEDTRRAKILKEIKRRKGE